MYISGNPVLHLVLFSPTMVTILNILKTKNTLKPLSQNPSLCEHLDLNMVSAHAHPAMHDG